MANRNPTICRSITRNKLVLYLYVVVMYLIACTVTDISKGSKELTLKDYIVQVSVELLVLMKISLKYLF